MHFILVSFIYKYVRISIYQFFVFSILIDISIYLKVCCKDSHKHQDVYLKF